MIVLSLIATVMTMTVTAAEKESVIRRHWFVRGQVQGVGFRAFTYESAVDLGARGWVRNLTDGRVEIVAEGNEKTLAGLLEKVKKGPRFARVDGVAEGKVDGAEKLAEKFEIRDSAEARKE